MLIIIRRDNKNNLRANFKAEVLNSFFDTCFNRFRPALTMDSIFISSCLCPFSQSDIPCTPEEVEHLLLGLDVSKASVPDLVSACMLKTLQLV